MSCYEECRILNTINSSRIVFLQLNKNWARKR